MALKRKPTSTSGVEKAFKYEMTHPTNHIAVKKQS